jgi:hypothetical protein
MKKYLVLPMLAVLGFTMVLSFFAATSALAQDDPYSEKYMRQHDGGDRAEYLQKMEHSDPWFYVPPVNDARFSTTNNN